MPKPRVTFSPEIVARLWIGLEAGRGLRRLCREPGMPSRSTVHTWMRRHPDLAATAARVSPAFKRRTIAARLPGVVRAFLCWFIRSPETR
jgi:hypothetical protein